MIFISIFKFSETATEATKLLPHSVVYEDTADRTDSTPLVNEATGLLYPFVIEFTLIAAAVWYRILSRVGKPVKKDPHASPQKNSKKQHECHKANSGLFLGMLLLVATGMVSVISVVKLVTYTAYKILLSIIRCVYGWPCSVQGQP